MSTPDTAVAIPGRTSPPWSAAETVYFYGGWLSNFAATPGLRLTFGYYGYHENDRVPVRSVEHWFQACKATSRQQFDLIMGCGSAAAAKRAGRETELRPDWEQVKFEVMLRALRGKFALDPFRSGVLLTHPRPLAEDSPSDFVWGCRDPEGGHGGQNLLGLALMRVRDELVADVRTRLTALAPGH
jgi:N-glycosidase YbiA